MSAQVRFSCSDGNTDLTSISFRNLAGTNPVPLPSQSLLSIRADQRVIDVHDLNRGDFAFRQTRA